MSKVLVVAAHPDDEVLGCVGTLFKRIADGDEVYSLILGEGVMARNTATYADKKIFKDINNEVGDVARAVGFKNNWHFNLPDNKFDSVPLLDVIQIIESIKDEVCPDVVYTHFCNDLNVDHRVTFNAVLTACRPLPEETVKEIYSFETCSSTEWVDKQVGFKPNVFVDISDFIDKKINAVSMYKSEMRNYPNPRSIEGVELMAKYRGITISTQFAEAFELIRKIC